MLLQWNQAVIQETGCRITINCIESFLLLVLIKKERKTKNNVEAEGEEARKMEGRRIRFRYNKSVWLKTNSTNERAEWKALRYTRGGSAHDGRNESRLKNNWDYECSG